MEARQRMKAFRHMRFEGADAIRYYELYRLMKEATQMSKQRLELQIKIKYTLVALLITTLAVSLAASSIFHYFGQTTIAMSFLGPLVIAIGGLVLARLLGRRISG